MMNQCGLPLICRVDFVPSPGLGILCTTGARPHLEPELSCVTGCRTSVGGPSPLRAQVLWLKSFCTLVKLGRVSGSANTGWRPGQFLTKSQNLKSQSFLGGLRPKLQ